MREKELHSITEIKRLQRRRSGVKIDKMQFSFDDIAEAESMRGPFIEGGFVEAAPYFDTRLR